MLRTGVPGKLGNGMYVGDGPAILLALPAVLSACKSEHPSAQDKISFIKEIIVRAHRNRYQIPGDRVLAIFQTIPVAFEAGIPINRTFLDELGSFNLGYDWQFHRSLREIMQEARGVSRSWNREQIMALLTEANGRAVADIQAHGDMCYGD